MDSSEKTTEHLINYVFISACMQIIVQTETIQQKQEAANRLQESNVLSTRSRATLQRAQGQCALKHHTRKFAVLSRAKLWLWSKEKEETIIADYTF